MIARKSRSEAYYSAIAVFGGLPGKVDFGALKGECVDLIPELARQRQEPRLRRLGRIHCARVVVEVSIAVLCVCAVMITAFVEKKLAESALGLPSWSVLTFT